MSVESDLIDNLFANELFADAWQQLKKKSGG